MAGKELKNRVLYVTGGKESAKKVADAIAAGIAQAATPVEKHTAALGVGVLFIGCETNDTGKIKGGVRKMLGKITSDEVKLVCGFATSSSGTGSIKAAIKAICEPKGIRVAEEEFICKGATAFGARGCPTEEDLKKAKEFSAQVLTNNRNL